MITALIQQRALENQVIAYQTMNLSTCSSVFEECASSLSCILYFKIISIESHKLLTIYVPRGLLLTPLVISWLFLAYPYTEPFSCPPLETQARLRDELFCTR